MAISDPETAHAIASIAGASAAAHVTLASLVSLHAGIDRGQFLDDLISLHSDQEQAAPDPLVQGYFQQLIAGLQRVRDRGA